MAYRKIIGSGVALAMAFASPAVATITKIDLSKYRTEVNPLITAITAAQVAAARVESGAYPGVGSLFVTYRSTATTGFGALCTGALTSNRTVLTAGHCLSNTTETGTKDPVTSVTFYLPDFGSRHTSGVTVIAGSDIKVDPNFDATAAFAGSDLAQFKLDTKVAFGGYQLYTAQDDSEIGSEFTRVGTGTTGDKKGTSAGPFDFAKRAGVNVWQYNGSDFFSDVPSTVLLSEFTDGTLAHDPFYQAGGSRQPPLVDSKGHVIEVNSSPGDSGGPEFIDGKIAGVTSFGVTGAIIDGACGRGHIDPYAGPDGACTNSSIGEISGDTQVSAFLPFINTYIASVPEPASWGMMIVGFGLVGGSTRRQRGAVTAVADGTC